MAQKILLADDSMTAQNMGKKILAEGGYEVVTVSNGAAAVKKIAEQRPELAILDVYMPGYSGLEVCERLRAALATAKLPVLLTVGKLEPFQPEEGKRVKADGLLIKPFEASDLLAAVKVLLEKAAAPAQGVDTVKREGLPQPVSSEYDEWKGETAPEEEKAHKIEVPQELAAAPAMADVLDMGAAQALPAEAKSAAVSAKSMVAAASAEAAPVFSIEPEVPDFTAGPLPAFDVDLHLDESAPTADAPPAIPRAVLDVIMPPVEAAKESPVSSPPFEEVEHTSDPQAPDMKVELLPDLEPTILQDAIPVEVTPDADLVTSPEEIVQFATKFGVDTADEEASAETAPEELDITQPEPALEAERSAEEASALEALESAAAGQDADLIVAPEAAIEAQPVQEQLEVEESPAVLPDPEPVGIKELSASVAEPEAVAVEELPAPEPEPEMAAIQEPTVPAAEPEPVVTEAAAATPAADDAFSLAQELQRAFAEVPEESTINSAVMTETPASPQDDPEVSHLVDRILERLKPELMAVIKRELKS